MTDISGLLDELRNQVESDQSLGVLNRLDKGSTDALFRGFTEWCKTKGIPTPMDEKQFTQYICEYLGLTTKRESYCMPDGTVGSRCIYVKMPDE